MIGAIRRGLKKTRDVLTGGTTGVFSSGVEMDEESIETLEEVLLTADVGISTIDTLLDGLVKEAKRSRLSPRDILKKRMMALWPDKWEQEGPPPAPWITLFIGVNGVGKTTTIGKLAAMRAGRGQKGLLAAADTFRAAAAEQLGIWSERSGIELIRQQDGADPAAVAYDAAVAAKARCLDFVFVDTAGRLHVKRNLMQELEKIHRVLGKACPGAPQQVTLVLDATTGQNGLSQARSFLEVVPVTDLILTKLDGTAKGGIALSIASELNLPIRYVGVGEKVEDLVPFDGTEYVEGMIS